MAYEPSQQRRLPAEGDVNKQDFSGTVRITRLTIKKMLFDLATPSEIGLELGQRLRTQRLQQNLQQAELAVRAGVSEGTVRNLETKGQATLESLLRIVIALGLVGEMAGLFIARPTSIKALQQQSAGRTRASRARR